MTDRSSLTAPLRVAIVGAGQMARNHAAVIARRASARLVGVHDQLQDRAEALARAANAMAFRSLDALIAEAKPDVIHVCTPPDAHVAAARAALAAGVPVYVEKPFAPTTAEAQELIELAAARHSLVCAGHQLLRDPAYIALADAGAQLGDIVRVDSDFSFEPPSAVTRSAAALARQTVDILPHPLYTLVAMMERFAPAGAPVELEWSAASSADVHAVLRIGPVIGRLEISLISRPIASTLSLVGTKGTVTADFVRSIVVGAANSGTAPLEKIANPVVEASQLVGRTTASLVRRLKSGGSYPGLAELIHAFHDAVTAGAPSPVPPEHLLRVTALFEDLVRRIRAPRARTITIGGPVRQNDAPLVAVTGAGGFLGSEIVGALERVRGIGRGTPPDGRNFEAWISADLSQGIGASVLEGVDVVVHAAAATSGGFEEHRRNTVEATRRLLETMRVAGVHRLVLISSLSVLRPPRHWRERQDEATPRADEPARFGPYVCGKTEQEALVVREAAALGIETRIIRPGALLDFREPEVPGLMGRRLFGRWHLGLGRPSLPIAVCDVRTCAQAIAWCATHFDEAPAIVNLFDPTLPTRATVIARLRSDGWRGRFVWMPISLISLGIQAARTMLAGVHGALPERLAVWSVLRPRRYDGRLASATLDAVADAAAAGAAAPRMRVA
jgi:predicted dehydrogenase/nucleoside-diphosphate-sugar epimerase